ncbi:MAG: hypothetical protein F4124_15080 [Acidimicrobiia bacterium]|nr:hypothetical protein [Acidimicrobiia bacterium]MYB75252.1 hypothetical protein [Acidimicrobiia bacterium]MYI00742.1 hypothetical protein [Acidimicrobiia bacterium]
MDEEDHTATVLRATGREDLGDALAWIQERRRLTGEVRTDELMAAVANLKRNMRVEAALREITRSALVSKVDPSTDLLAVEAAVRPRAYREALEEVARYTSSGSLADLSVEAVYFAQERNPLVLATLGLVAGLAWRDLRDRVAGLASSPGTPASPEGPWDLEQISAALVVIDRVLKDTEVPQLEGATPARPIELMFSEDQKTGWDAVASLMHDGVSYETLLAQRAVGGAWLSHRQATTGQIPALIADELCCALDNAGLSYRRGTVVGGDVSKAALRTLLQGEPGQVGVVVVSGTGKALLAIAISVARDGGTARKSGGRLRTLPSQFGVPAAVVLIGHGWAARGESMELIKSFDGRVFTEQSVEDLVTAAIALTQEEER